MADNDKKPLIVLVPAILTGAAALIAALTTVYINVRDGKAPESAKPVAQAAAQPSAAQAAVATQSNERLRLQVDRIAVQDDGSVGTTDWRFSVEVDGEPLYAFQQDGLDDEGGRNIARPREAGATLRIGDAGRANVVVKGWRGSRLRVAPGEPDVRGEGVLASDGAIAPIKVAAAEPGRGAFTFYFSGAPARDD